MMDQGNSTGSPTAEKVTPASGNATPAPWRIHTVYPSEIYATVDEKRHMVADVLGAGTAETDRANAAFIVKAVNSHDALVKALEEIAEGTGPFSRDPLTHASNCIDSMKEIARAALEANL